MPLVARVNKYTDYGYLQTNPASEDDVRNQMDGAVQEVFDKASAAIDLKSNLGSPTLTTISTGFLANWSGTITYWKNQENLVTVSINLTRSADILSTLEGLYPPLMPVGFRPSVQAIQLVNLYTSANVSVAGSFANITMDTTGTIIIFPVTSTTLTNARQIRRVTFSYYAA